MKLPADLNLPCFAYGLFKPGELAFKKILKFVSKDETFQINNSSFIRDGIPILDLKDTECETYGYILWFSHEYGEQAYLEIDRFVSEGNRSWYQWSIIENEGAKINVLCGNEPQKGSIKSFRPYWTARKDPLFRIALKKIKSLKAKYELKQFRDSNFNWDAFFELQMAYLLLWAAIERYCTFAYGITKEPIEKIHDFARSEEFRAALEKTLRNFQQLPQIDTIYDSRLPDGGIRLDPGQPIYSIDHFYRVRSNLVHRGKSEWRDGEIIRISLIELFDIFKNVLKQTILPEIDELLRDD